MARPISDRFWERVSIGKENECWEWTGAKNTAGYGQIKHNRYQIGAHRIAWLLENGSLPKGKLVCHHCDNPSCVNQRHLFLGTHKDNMLDKTRKGRNGIPKGEDSVHCRLTDKQINRIRILYSLPKVSQLMLAETFGVVQQHISRIINFKRRTFSG